MIPFLIWFTGFIPAYFLWKKIVTSDGEVWTRRNRLKALLVASFSWLYLAFIAIIIPFAVIEWNDLDKPAKW